MNFHLCLDSKEMRLIHDCISFAINEGTLLRNYSIEEFCSVLFTLTDTDPIDFNEALDYVTDLLGEDTANSLSKEIIIKIYDSSHKHCL